MKFDQTYKLDDNKIERGVWRTLPSGLKVKVASLRSPKYTMAITRLKKEYAKDFNINDQDVINQITCKAMAETILLDWDGAEDLDGKELPYSKEIAAQFLLKYPVFREEVAQVSVSDNNYKPEDIAEK